MKLEELVSTSDRVGNERARNKKIAIIAELLRKLDAQQVPIGVAYLSGEICQGRIGVGFAAISKMRELAAASQATLELGEVDLIFSRIAETRGSGSTARRLSELGHLFSRATAVEQSFLSRLLFGELRQGAQEGVMAEAIAKASNLPASDVRRALMLSGHPGAVASAALSGGAAALGRFRLELGRPLQPMLAQTAEDSADGIDRLGRAQLEYKLDGARVQVHRDGSDVKIFSRQLNDVTAAVPELVESVLELPVRQVVLDGEAIVLRADRTPHLFQTTMRRFSRRLEVETQRRELPLESFYFDILHLDGQDLIDRPGSERMRAIDERIPADQVIPRTIAESPEDVDEFLARALASGHEGLMMKSIDAPYEAGRRGAAWLKLKPAHTLDLVVLAVEWGSGRRKGTLSNLHLGARDPEHDGFVMLGKTFKGMTDQMLAWQTKRLLELETHREGQIVYVRPELVVEVAFDGLQHSPHYPAGLALRFARVKRYRDDKPANQADTIDQVRAIFAAQSRLAPSA